MSKEAHMNRLLLLALIALALGNAPALAQSQQPYAGLEHVPSKRSPTSKLPI
jgi:hypothetical protein